MRQRQLWADAKTTNGWDFSGGQGWSLAAETTKGLTRGTEILPSSIDPQYVAGFVWTRQYSFRVSKDFGKSVFLGVSAKVPATLSPSGTGLPTNYVFAASGDGGGLYNSANLYSANAAPALPSNGLRTRLGSLGNLQHQPFLPGPHLSEQRHSGSNNVSIGSGIGAPVRKTIEETCPSPVARRLMMNRTAPAGRLPWL